MLNLPLRRLSESLILIGSAMSGYKCRTTVIFETLKDGSLEINSLALNNCFSYRKIFQNDVNALSNMVKKKKTFFFFFFFFF